MKRRSASELFDMARFRADVAAHMTRWRMTARDLANECGCTDNAIMPWLRGDRDAVGLLVVCALADVVDLSLDKYRRPVR